MTQVSDDNDNADRLRDAAMRALSTAHDADVLLPISDEARPLALADDAPLRRLRYRDPTPADVSVRVYTNAEDSDRYDVVWSAQPGRYEQVVLTRPSGVDADITPTADGLARFCGVERGVIRLIATGSDPVGSVQIEWFLLSE